MQILTPIVIDLMNPDPLPIINAKQGDTGRGIRVTVTTDGQICQCASEEVNIFIRKPDGKLIYNGCDIQGGDVVVMFTSQALAVHGQLQVELEILSGEKKVSTPIAVINVLPTNINAEAIESTNEFNRYETIITEMEASEAERSEAEDKRVAAEAARAEAESERSEAEGDRAAAETERISAETERMKAEALRTQAEALRRQAEEARAAAEELREAAKLAMQQATEAANAAAEAARDYVLGDISEKTITFTEATERVDLESGESMATLFGKIKKWSSDLVTGAGSTLLGRLFSSGKVLISDNDGKVAESDVSTKDLANISGTTGNLQEQLTELNGKLLKVKWVLLTTEFESANVAIGAADISLEGKTIVCAFAKVNDVTSNTGFPYHICCFVSAKLVQAVLYSYGRWTAENEKINMVAYVLYI